MNNPAKTWFNEHGWQPFAGLDLRSLALFRVVLAVTLLAHIALYWVDASAFFADFTGLLQRHEAMRNQSAFNWSILYLSNTPLFFHLFFAVYALAAISLLLGYRTRLMVIICWACTISLRTRAVSFNSLGDIELVILLFWGMFLPLGARFSIDAALRKIPIAGNHYASVASLGLIVAIACVYFFAAMEQSGPAWTKDFTAITRIVANPENGTPFTPYLLALGSALKPLTMLVYYLQLLSPILIFLPAHTAVGRMVIVPLLLLMQLGIALFLSQGIFPLISIAGLCALLPAMFWDEILKRGNARTRRQNIAMFYDQHCEFCLKCCLIFRTLGLPPTTPVLPAQQDAEAATIFASTNSWVVRTHDDEMLTGWRAVSYIWRRSPLLFPLGYLFALPGFEQLGEALYRLITKHRPKLSNLTAHALARHENPLYRPSFVTSTILAFLAIIALLGNLNNIYGNYSIWPRWADMTLRTVGLDQSWSFFAPEPYNGSIWVVVQGTLANRDPVDLMTMKITPPSMNKPEHGWNTLPDYRWRRFFSRINWKEQGDRVAGYYCREWEQRYPDIQLESVQIVHFWQLANNKPNSNLTFNGNCRPSAPKPAPAPTPPPPTKKP